MKQRGGRRGHSTTVETVADDSLPEISDYEKPLPYHMVNRPLKKVMEE